MRSINQSLFIIGMGITLVTACSMDNSNEMPTRADGAAFFSENCASCHGSDAQGSGPAASGLPVPPPNLTTLSAQNGGDFPKARALSYIYGNPEKSHLTRVMPEFGEDMALDLVPIEIDNVLTPTPRALAGLLFYLEGIQQ
ncbi:cytochrome c [Roseovarius sp. EL26]|uniref:cytochrome c n=1 Tax=Roseovarius sp. EL26 TaxID=2126672 RepID=UPI0020B11F8E|nr:cytochrome c [Roseovarius sp. EL26]